MITFGDDGDEVVIVVVVVLEDELAVVKHFVLKLLPMQTTMTFELPFVDDVCDCELSVLCGWKRDKKFEFWMSRHDIKCETLKMENSFVKKILSRVKLGFIYT